jgi:hypothetical protein
LQNFDLSQLPRRPSQIHMGQSPRRPVAHNRIFDGGYILYIALLRNIRTRANRLLLPRRAIRDQPGAALRHSRRLLIPHPAAFRNLASEVAMFPQERYTPKMQREAGN